MDTDRVTGSATPARHGVAGVVLFESGFTFQLHTLKCESQIRKLREHPLTRSTNPPPLLYKISKIRHLLAYPPSVFPQQPQFRRRQFVIRLVRYFPKISTKQNEGDNLPCSRYHYFGISDSGKN